ncbi:prepilin-type N-terminal cleavage/methylation domain-containing protein [Virgibacillus halodenitrificans]|uniref:prepilin-type N-terminal cleavage/methylation domain-containing protein n=1 Tax=Virgibacillus halodenitrificans TaxID=1482 RepID=UPI000EF4B4C2|nr:prepilin-type N-terminal cleavage/methylation domain-containing protein [Virgibacillus halodenitrificans]
MRICQFKSEKGMTLVELLAALALFGLIVALSSGVIVQLMDSEQKTSASISVKQEANVVMSDLRSQFYTKDTNKICLPPDTPLKVAEAQIINGVEKQMDSDGCVNDVDQQEPIEMNLTFSDTANKQEIELQTSWAGREEHVLALEKVDGCENNDDDCDSEDDKENSLICVYLGDHEYTNLSLKKGFCKSNTYLMGKGNKTASVKLGKQLILEENVTLKIHKSVLDVETIILENNSKIITNGNSEIKLTGRILCNGKEIDKKQNNATIHCKY